MAEEVGIVITLYDRVSPTLKDEGSKGGAGGTEKPPPGGSGGKGYFGLYFLSR